MRFLDRSRSRLPRPLRTAIDWTLCVCLAVVAVLGFQAEVAKPYRIPTPSMEPTLHCAKPVSGCHSRVSDRILVNRLAYRSRGPERGDIVVFDTPARVESVCGTGGAYVKRVVGLPGEKVSMRHGLVLIDGLPLAEPYLRSRFRGDETGTWGRVARDRYFVLGDNRADSCDSRRWGTVRRDDVIGKAELIYWPPNRVGAP